MTLRPRDRIALAAVLFLALVGVFYMAVLKPEQKKASTLGATIAAQRLALIQAESTYAAGRAAQAALKTSAADWAALRRAVPDKSDIPALLRALETNANAVHVKMTAIQLSGSSGTGATTSPGKATSSSVATSVPLQLSFIGGYAALNSLVHRLNGLVVVSGNAVHATGPLLSISNVSLSGAQKLTVQLTATIYQLDAAIAAASVPTGGQS